MTSLTKQLLLVILVLLVSSCGGGSSDSGNSSGDTVEPVADLIYTVNFSNNEALAASNKIILTFDKTIDLSKVSITGSLATESDGGVWSASTSANDTLTISPASSWSAGGNKTLLVEVRDTSGNVIQTINLNYTIDGTSPLVSNVSPVSGNTIGGSQQIIIVFNESMDMGSLVLSGTMQAKSDAGVWSSTGENSNDKLTLTPSSSWSAGAGQTLILDINDKVGNPLESLNLTYDVNLSAPSVSSINAANGTILLAAQSIVITFDRSMDTGSLLIGGNMVAEAGSSVWSNTNTVNDTLTISPASTWTVGYWDNNDGIAQELTIDATDLLGNPLSKLRLGYIVDVISVSNSGDDANPGTMNFPMAKIYSAIQYADSIGVKNVYIQAGDYSGTTFLIDGINVKGGFDDLWIYDSYRETGHKVTQGGSGGEAFVVYNFTTETKVENMVLIGSNASGLTLNSTSSSHVMRIANSNNLILNDVHIIAANGANGIPGDNGIDITGGGQAGSPGESAQSLLSTCNNTTAGAGGNGGGSGDRLGGNGGKGGTVDTSCSSSSNYDAGNGQRGADADAYASSSNGRGGSGGQGDTTGSCDDSLVGANGGDGVNGNNGANGIASTAPTGQIVNSSWLVTGDGGDGAAGSIGMGGGGGGGSGGCDSGTDKYGAGGGGGGAGGLASTSAGKGGKAGGYSIGLLVLNSSISINNSDFTLGVGGTGGDGGASGSGQVGGTGGTGGGWVDGRVNNGVAGGNGGNGGKGGNSGAGAGGAGGSAYGIYSESSTITTNNTTFTGGMAGLGGRGGLGGNGTNNGVNGIVVNNGP